MSTSAPVRDVPPRRPRRRIRTGVAVAAIGLTAGVAGGAAIMAVEGGGSSAPATVTQIVSPAATSRVADTSPAAAAVDWEGVAAAATPGVVTITATVAAAQEQGYPGEPGGQGSGTAQGTGFVIDSDGHIVTCQHVVADATKVTVHFSDGSVADATVVGTDASSDVAVIDVDVDADRLRPIALGSAEDLGLGEPVLAVGSPFGYEGSVSAGIVSGLGREITSPNGFTLVDAVQTDAAVNHGNSGGPLLDRDGRAVGVNAQIADSGVNANVGIAFSVPINAHTKEIVSQLIGSGRVSHAWLGISGSSIDPALAASGAVKADQGVVITGIASGGPADQAGLQAGSETVTLDGQAYCVGGSVVTAVDGTAVRSMTDLQSALQGADPGSSVELTVVDADGGTRTVAVTLGEQPASAPQVESGCQVPQG